MIYPIIALLLVASHAIAFYKGYDYADDKAELAKARAQIEQLKTSERYLREANNAAQNEASEATKSLETNTQTIDLLNSIIRDITENPICVDPKVLELMRKLK